MYQVKQTSIKFENKHGIERAFMRNFRIRSQNRNTGTFFLIFFLILLKITDPPRAPIGLGQSPSSGCNKGSFFLLVPGACVLVLKTGLYIISCLS